ncbi:hypothetical protein [Streptomyces avicenniae]|uniref:hypothetical protein n=1 Tax=Streptomyces avicenniae TaxID=500153 RepID=UPI00069A4569|nr:hypothetical protein [Streptomyces avicenniae]
MVWRKPVGRLGRAPLRAWTVTDTELWTHAVCGRVLPGWEGRAATGGATADTRRAPDGPPPGDDPPPEPDPDRRPTP